MDMFAMGIPQQQEMMFQQMQQQAMIDQQQQVLSQTFDPALILSQGIVLYLMGNYVLTNKLINTYTYHVISTGEVAGNKKVLLNTIKSLPTVKKGSKLSNDIQYSIKVMETKTIPKFEKMMAKRSKSKHAEKQYQECLSKGITLDKYKQWVTFLKKEATPKLNAKIKELEKLASIKEAYELEEEPVQESVTNYSNPATTNSILLEYYAGKNKDLIKCEDYCREIIEMIKKDNEKWGDLTRQRSTYRDAEPCKKLEKTLAKLFKLKGLYLYWNSGNISASSWTPSVVSSFTDRRNIAEGKKTNLNARIVIYEELVLIAGLNEQELLAVILYEIGHNLYYSPLLIVSNVIMIILTLPFGWLLKLIYGQVLTAFNNIRDFLKSHCPAILNVTFLFHSVWNQLESILKVPNSVLYVATAVERIRNIASISPVAALWKVSNISSYESELVADSLAAKYGYGPELISAMKKVDHPEGAMGEKIAKKFGLFGTVTMDVCDIMVDIAQMATLEPHPNLNLRARKSLDKLKKDLANGDYPPEMQHELEENIALMEKAYKSVNDVNSDKNGIQIKKAWYGIVDTITHGHSDIREIFHFLMKDSMF